jgi:hypothetical protein
MTSAFSRTIPEGRGSDALGAASGGTVRTASGGFFLLLTRFGID